MLVRSGIYRVYPKPPRERTNLFKLLSELYWAVWAWALIFKMKSEIWIVLHFRGGNRAVLAMFSFQAGDETAQGHLLTGSR